MSDQGATITFDAAKREGNCVEYAELFASILNREDRRPGLGRAQ